MTFDINALPTWSDDALREAELAMNLCDGRWRDKIAAAVTAAVRQHLIEVEKAAAKEGNDE